MRPTIVRAGAVYLPLLVTLVLLARRRPRRSDVAGIVAGCAWNVPALLALNVVALRVGWWSFDTAGSPAVEGVPVELWLGWALLWGAVPVLVRPRSAVPALVVADLVLMPLAAPVVRLDGTWLVGEAVAVGACLVPGALLGWWTATQARLRQRVVLLVGAFGGLLLYVVPALAFAAGGVSEGDGEGWSVLLARPRWHFVLAAVVLAPFGAMAVQAVREFAVVGGGTPVPLDPPRRLVTTGPYAYVRNPMQLGATVVAVGWGVLLADATVVAAGLMAAVFSAGVAAWAERAELSGRFGTDWDDYRSRVRLWVPTWRPRSDLRGARTLVAATCDPCTEVGGFLQRRGVTVLAAEDVEPGLTRIGYVDGPVRETGIPAVARSLEQVHLGWAAAGWVARLPVIAPLLQLIADAVGAGPRPLGVRSGHGWDRSNVG